MLSKENNELMTRVGPGTPMGELLRRYWIPAALASELSEPDCPPVRVKLLGEKLVAFRDTAGRVGLMDEFCAHRRASLFLGRNEEHGLRCVYHGWKYDVDGRCVDMPNEPPESDFKHKIHLKSYAVAELGGVIWAYLGPKEKIPPAPKFEWTQVPEDHRVVRKMWQDCNWLQAVDGNFDTTHPSFLHRKLTANSKAPGINPVNSIFMISPTAPRLAKMEIERANYGYYYAQIRSMGGGKNHVAINYYVMPFHQMRATTSGGEVKGSMIEGHIPVPIDDDNSMEYTWRYSLSDEMCREMLVVEQSRGRGEGEMTSDFRKIRNKDNHWLMDRQMQRTETYTGITGVNIQDHAIQESMGPIADRTQEHLGNADRTLIATRRMLMEAVKNIQNGEDPPGVGSSYYTIRPITKMLMDGIQWREALKDEICDGNGSSGAN